MPNFIIMAGAKIVGVHEVDNESCSAIQGISGCLLEAHGSFFLALPPVVRPRDCLRWFDLQPGLECEVLYEDVWYEVSCNNQSHTRFE